jgi:hypothetical protein
VFGEGILVRDGVLTDQGARFLQRRLPFDSDALTVGLPVTDVVRIFQRVGTWVRVIQGLLAHSPTTCPSCGSKLAKPIAARAKCTSCESEIDLPAGDDLNRRWVEEYYRAETAQTGSAQAATAEH